MDNLLIMLEGLSIAPWEAAFFAFLMAVYILIGMYKSSFIIAFGFVFYWGCKNFISVSDGFSQRSLILYSICGIIIIGLVSLNHFLKDFKRA